MFNGNTDGITAPYGTPDFYIKFRDMTRVHVYGKDIECERVLLKKNEYVLFALSDKLRIISKTWETGIFI